MSFRPVPNCRAAGLVFLMVVAPATASAQAAIAGSVKDPQGAPMAGVTVEASSPSLIERRRTAVTDMTGRYRIEDLRPGRYAVRFTLKGWTPVERTGVELTGTLTATVLLPARMTRPALRQYAQGGSPVATTCIRRAGGAETTPSTTR